VGTGGGKTTPQALFNLINSLTAETAPVAADKVALYDASASQADAVTFATLIGASKVFASSYVGSGSSGKTVTLTGVNRAYLVIIMSPNVGPNGGMFIPFGTTGNFSHTTFNSVNLSVSLDAPSAGTAQVLTINTNNTAVNQNGTTYHIFAIGTPT